MSFCIRTVSLFASLGQGEEAQWRVVLQHAVRTALAAKEAFERDGLVVQTVRLLTNSFEVREANG
jgi:hypothetical protein